MPFIVCPVKQGLISECVTGGYRCNFYLSPGRSPSDKACDSGDSGDR